MSLLLSSKRVSKAPYSDEYVSNRQAATGKPARYQPVEPSWEAFDTFGVPELEDSKLMFGMTQCSGGRYFGPEPSENKTAGLLKAAAALSNDEEGLVSAKKWFGKNFA